MKEKTLEFIEELESWRQENPDERNFIVVVHEENSFTAIDCEGDSAAMCAGILSSVVEEKVSPEKIETLMNTVDKISYVLNNMEDFFKWVERQHEKDS